MANTRLASIITEQCSSMALGFDALIYSTCVKAQSHCPLVLLVWNNDCLSVRTSRISRTDSMDSHIRESILTLHLSIKALSLYGELREYVTRHSELYANSICIKFCKSLQAAKFTLLNHELETLYKWGNS